MVKKKTGAAKKREKQKERQKQIALGTVVNQENLSKLACNQIMECWKCGNKQKNRAACYFCSTIQNVVQCGECGRTKCQSDTGECLIRHKGPATGTGLVGAICDFCECFICHSKKCIETHACKCPFRDSKAESAMPVVCFECDRTAWNNGGRFFQCGTCEKWLCEDDQFEHQASCQTLDGDEVKCIGCSRKPQWACLRCKICFCSIHIHSNFKWERGKAPPCKKCQQLCMDASMLSLSARQHEFGRQQAGADSGFDYPSFASYADFQSGGAKDEEDGFEY
eukprot:TRINITY_DN780214_c0_g1_i1.p1 TRINITY_DN780214_c0_g1~~TRINITY_DN780214_c0_g1_i1.p1  ORF type:complete len:280 (-),score=76.39 TRINITY_DN780214_c0_g1_i1:152-991(-)